MSGDSCNGVTNQRVKTIMRNHVRVSAKSRGSVRNRLKSKFPEKADYECAVIIMRYYWDLARIEQGPFRVTLSDHLYNA